jgi:hypothetical protein
MYLLSPTLKSLRDFLVGFSVGRHFSADFRKDGRPFDDFSAWFSLHRRAPCAGAGGWYGAIMDESSDDQQAFERFFDYLATYRQAMPVLEYHFRLTPRQQRPYSIAQRSRAPHRLRLTRHRGERCLFLHARLRGVPGWYMHTGFESIPQSRRWLAKVFGITDKQWEVARNDEG